ncbi:MAG TPA: phosphodiester glycosidase family protein [bacterium]|nr:phosphodiester glycosidase family protein [bacterium]
MPQDRSRIIRRLRSALLAAVGVILFLIGAGYVIITQFPSVGAYGADLLRDVVGDQAVARLETASLEIQDAVHTAAHKLGHLKPLAPWALVTRENPATPPPLAPPAAESTRVAPPRWPPRPLAPLGSVQGEGQWLAYLSDSTGATVAYRTFLQPDSTRPYAVVAIVAFDLEKTALEFVLGTEEPASKVSVDRPGTIPAVDRCPGRLLAVFNGGFKARHGYFGVRVGGVTVIPAREGFGTVEVAADGHTRIGIWGTDIVPSRDARFWRQNGPLIVHDGQVNPHTADTDPLNWGFTVAGVTATWRSALGISADDKTLFYIAGPSLTMRALARAVAACGASQAIQLDINSYWVHFEAIHAAESRLHAQPLLESMKNGTGRYFSPYSRDFFYVVAAR